jgi:hypothetical protein
MVIKYLYQFFPLQDPPKFTQIGIFGLKTNHLATLLVSDKTLVVQALGIWRPPISIIETDLEHMHTSIHAYTYVHMYIHTHKNDHE